MSWSIKKREIAEVISRIEDVSIRVIPEKRYLAFLPWDRIAADMGYSVCWTHAKHEAGLALCKISLPPTLAKVH